MKSVLFVGFGLVCAGFFFPPSVQDAALAQGKEAPLKNLPALRAGTYKADPYIRAAAMLQTLSKGEAYNALLVLVKEADQNSQTVVLCRMLFSPKTNGEFRRARIGGAKFLGDTGYEDWPLEPIEVVDGVPFLITYGYKLSGVAESAGSYLIYCIRNCDWGRDRFAPRSKEEKHKALGKLLASPKWKRGLDEDEKAFLVSQVTTEGEKPGSDKMWEESGSFRGCFAFPGVPVWKESGSTSGQGDVTRSKSHERP
jgi:hypothetical protein